MYFTSKCNHDRLTHTAQELANATSTSLSRAQQRLAKWEAIGVHGIGRDKEHRGCAFVFCDCLIARALGICPGEPMLPTYTQCVAMIAKAAQGAEPETQCQRLG